MEDLQRGSTIRRLISSCIKDDYYISASLIHLYMQCGDITNAQLLFDTTTTKKHYQCYIKNNQPNKAIDLFNEIKNPNEIIINLLFNACAELRTEEALNLIKKVSQDMSKSFYSNPHLLTSLLDALIKCSDCSNAEIVFTKITKSIIHYGSLMNGFNKENNPLKTLHLFNQMKLDGFVLDLIIYLCVLKALSKIGDESICQINCYGVSEMGIQAIELYRKIPTE
ncbi:unnamed protein product [Rotaria sordida]|uniref:Pentatricopeptide repeat-containing protein n=1 Tax=Rotaria sordida TaxID=392033 RepID=A0A818NZ19_9BILA|nr:unnamed protein product [Rotaria sordida]